MPGVKTNERPGTRAVLRHYRMSAYKARQVLDLVRGQEVDRAADILRGTPREGARVVAKVLASAVANARNNDGLEPDELYVSACFADEGTTAKRWRPRARGRATRIRKRTCHITVIVSRLPDDRLARRRAKVAASASAMRSRRVAASRRDRRAGGGADAAASVPSEDTTDTTDLELTTDEATQVADEATQVADEATQVADETTAEVADETTDEATQVADETTAEVADAEEGSGDAEEKD